MENKREGFFLLKEDDMDVLYFDNLKDYEWFKLDDNKNLDLNKVADYMKISIDTIKNNDYGYVYIENNKPILKIKKTLYTNPDYRMFIIFDYFNLKKGEYECYLDINN